MLQRNDQHLAHRRTGNHHPPSSNIHRHRTSWKKDTSLTASWQQDNRSDRFPAETSREGRDTREERRVRIRLDPSCPLHLLHTYCCRRQLTAGNPNRRTWVRTFLLFCTFLCPGKYRHRNTVWERRIDHLNMSYPPDTGPLHTDSFAASVSKGQTPRGTVPSREKRVTNKGKR